MSGNANDLNKVRWLYREGAYLRLVKSILIVLLSGSCCLGQTFEVLSIKPVRVAPGSSLYERMKLVLFDSMAVRGVPTQGGHVNIKSIPLQSLVATGFGVESRRVIGPAWLAEEYVELKALIPEESRRSDMTADEKTVQIRLMFQAALKERFHMEVHEDTRESSGYALEVAKNGLRLKVADLNRTKSSENSGGSRPLVDPNRKRHSYETTAAPLTEFARSLGNMLRLPIVDHTGKTKLYSIVIDLPKPDGPGDDDEFTRWVRALREQCGLELKKTKVSQKVFVIDHMDRTPTEN